MPLIGDKLKQEENRKLLANPRVQAILNTIAYAEGADYNTRVGGSTFNDFSKKPGKSTYIKSIGTNSTAEGRYQFLNKTWDAVAKDLNLTDFSPQSQDLAAIELIKRRGAMDDVLAGNLDGAVSKLNKEWASLPTASGRSAYGGQRARSMGSLKEVFENGAGTPSAYRYSPEEQGYTGEIYRPQNIPSMNPDGQTNNLTPTAAAEEDTEEEKAAKQEIEKVTAEKESLQDFYNQQQTTAPQQQEQYQQPVEASPSLLDQYAQVSQFVDTPIAQTGGFIKDNRGQWAHPGQNTEISSPHITMEGVNYPVLGISKETGEKKMMMPNLNYYFDKTQNVMEIPMMQQAGMLKINNPLAPPTLEEIMAKSLPAGSTKGQGYMLNEVVIPARKKAIDPRFANVKPILSERGEAITKKDSFEPAQKADINAVKKDAALYDKQIKEEITNRTASYEQRSNALDVAPEHIDAATVKTPTDVKTLQQRLVNAGYNLNPEGKFENQGIDGKMGKVTKRALEEFNQSGEKGKYTSFKSGVGELGQCKETQCSEYAQNELYRNLKPNVDRDTWNAKTGLTGDAWRIGSNIIEKGGKKLDTSKGLKGLRAGDVVTMYTGGSPYESEALKYGTDATHVGIVDKVNPDGSYYLLHNVHEGNAKDGFKGVEKRNLVTPDGKVHTSKDGHFPIRGVYRPNFDAADVTGKSAKVREDVGLQIDPQKVKALQGMDKSLFGTNVVQRADTYMKPLNSVDNKRVMAQKHGLSETEYQSLAKVTLGIMGQETGLGTSAKALPKQIAANILSSMELKQGETSRGASQLKYNTNYGSSDLTELGINRENFAEDKNVPLVTMDILAKHYKTLLKSGIPKEQALYKAVEKYNRGHNTKYSDTNDSDYANKVMHYADMFNTVDSKGVQYNTLVEKANLHENTVKKQKTLAHK